VVWWEYSLSRVQKMGQARFWKVRVGRVRDDSRYVDEEA
jgi:hypothetical protein